MASPAACPAGGRSRPHTGSNTFVTARAGAVAVALLASACASGSSDGGGETTLTTSTDAAAETVESVPPEFTATPAPTSAPENTVETVETVGTVETPVAVDGKDVVTRAAGVEGDGVLPQNVGSVTARVTSADGEVCEVCLWLADDDTSRQRGLMGVTDLGDAVGMAFRWDQLRTGNFFMFQTPTPLSIAWFDAAGFHVGEADMEPCMVDNSAICERYTSEAPYVLAVEMFGGQLGAIGIAPGSSIELVDLPCTSIPG